MFKCGCIIANTLIDSIKLSDKDDIESCKINCPFCGVKNSFKNDIIQMGLSIEELEEKKKEFNLLKKLKKKEKKLIKEENNNNLGENMLNELNSKKENENNSLSLVENYS